MGARGEVGDGGHPHDEGEQGTYDEADEAARAFREGEPPALAVGLGRVDGVRLEDVCLVAVVDKRRGELVGLCLRLSLDLELFGQGLGDVVGRHGDDIAGLIGPALPAHGHCGPGFL